MRCELLRFVENEKPPRDRTSADKRERFNLDQTTFQQSLVGLDHRRAAVPVAPVVPPLRRVHRHRQGVVAILKFLRDFLRRELRLLGRLRGNQHFERVVVGLQPRLHLLFERSGQESDVLPERDHGTRNRQAIVTGVFIHGLVQGACDRNERLPRASFAETRQHVDAFIEQAIHEKLLLEVARANRNTPGRLDEIRQLQSAHNTFAIITGRHRLALVRAQQDVFIEVKRLRRLIAQIKNAFRAEALQFVDVQRQLAVAGFLIRLGDFVVEIILRLEAHGARLELHVHIFGDENRRRRGLLLHKKRRCDDPVILLREVRQNRPQSIHRRRAASTVHQIRINDNREGAAVRQLDSFMHRARVGQELLQDAMHPARIAAALRGLFTLDTIQLLEDLDGNR